MNNRPNHMVFLWAVFPINHFPSTIAYFNSAQIFVSSASFIFMTPAPSGRSCSWH